MKISTQNTRTPSSDHMKFWKISTYYLCKITYLIKIIKFIEAEQKVCTKNMYVRRSKSLTPLPSIIRGKTNFYA